MQDDLIPYLKIIRCPKVGPKTFLRLFDQFAGDSNLILKFLKNNEFNIPSDKDIHNEVNAFLKMKGTFLFFKDENYPNLLKAIDAPPPILMVLGNLDVLKKEALSIIGARNASLIGQRYISRIANFFAEHNFAIVSGLARGMDTAAHKASVEQGTIAVLSGGVDQIYPQENKSLYEAIQEKGVILSEMPLGTVPSAQLFARRNRIISGLSKATIISEAAKHSGSMITAEFALTQGREVFVVPSHPSDPRSEGGNWLIQQGAHLFQKEQDVLDVLNSLPKTQKIEQKIIFKKQEEKISQNENDMTEPKALEDKILTLLNDIPIEMEDLFNHFSEVDMTEIMSTLSRLNLKGSLIIHPNQTISRI
ncbi:MAG: DNA-processing protein DprA [Proteobacteria bacterium]|nr:DNA-processing protein DprA [Pseudomonadota bacterium]